MPNTESAQPEVLADLPEGAATTLPFWEDQVLHIGTRHIPWPETELVSAHGTTLAGLSQERGSSWGVVDGEEAVPMAESIGMLVPVLSPDGGTVAWSSYVDEDTRELVVWDVATRRELGTIRRDVEVVCCDQAGEITVVGVQADGRVFFHDTRDVYAWRAGQEPIKVTGMRSIPYGELWPGGVMFQGKSNADSPAPGVFGTVDELGRFTRVGSTVSDQLGEWNGAGSAYASPGNGGELRVEWPIGDREAMTMALPGTRRWEVVGWEDDEHVIALTRNPEQGRIEPRDLPGVITMVRCAVSTGACERVAVQPESADPVLPNG